MSLAFRWLGVAGVELRVDGQRLAIDPFFTRPSLMGLINPVKPDTQLVAEKLPACEFVLVTHPHWDHLMDVPDVLQHTRATAFGSANTCQLLRVLGVPDLQIKETHVGDKLSLGAFEVEVIEGQHSPIPGGRLFNGDLRPGLQPPLRLQDYRMDCCLGYCIQASGERVLVCAAQPHPAGLLFTVAQEPRDYYIRLFQGVQPHTIVPIHWDNFLHPLSKPMHRFRRPGRMHLQQLTGLAQQILPQVQVLIPEIFREYTVRY
ncbi:MAG: hypothetical protein A2Y88_13535 [Chloroflexi bacterium RBG_13_48_10]|nr:MAG: hypothetical protein A2Y88_13535 [Chloroflexi bacterium RBG_13_48_10]